MMNFNEKLIELRKSKGLSQEELGNELGVSRQTVSKWELAQSYPDFQRLVLLSDYFKLPLDSLIKDVDLQEVREKIIKDKKLLVIYDEVSSFKNTINIIINSLAVFGIAGIFILILIIFIFK